MKLAVSGAFVGALTAFVAWSLQWAVEARRDVTFELPGTTTTLIVGAGPPAGTGADTHAVVQELKEFLATHSLSLIIASVGDGYPQMIVYDPEGSLAWFRAVGDGASDPAKESVYLFEDSYSAQRWAQSHATPLLPAGAEVAGVIAPPAGARNLQYVRPLGSFDLPAGRYIVNTGEADRIREFAEIIGRLGLRVHDAQQMPLLEALTRDPLIGVTSLLLVLGYGCAATYWSLSVRARDAEFVIRQRHGATRSMLVRQWWVRGLAPLAIGLVLGVAASGAVAVAVGREALPAEQYRALATAAALGFLPAAAVWQLAVFAAVPRLEGKRRAA